MLRCRSAKAPQAGRSARERMTEEDKWQYLVDLDERLLLGGVILSEWAAFLIRDADTAFVGGAHLASIITGLAGVETHLRGEGGSSNQRLGIGGRP